MLVDHKRSSGTFSDREPFLSRGARTRRYWSKSYGEIQKWNDRFEVFATLFFGLIMTHPFHDANKRTAFLSLLYHMELEGWCPAVDEAVFEDFTVEIAEHGLGKYKKYRELEATMGGDAEVLFIAHWLRINVRKIDLNARSITFRALNTILAKFGFLLEDSHANHIDVVRVEPNGNRIRVGRIGFPRWGAQVSKRDIKLVREMTNLTAQSGVDSAAFFEDAEPISRLIATYHEPLARLANR